MDDLDDIKESEFVTDTDDQDSLDEKIDLEQRIRNQQLWTSFQNAACCITKLYKDRTQPNISPWVPFQNAASNLTTLYKDCIESQRRFAKLGYQVGRRRRSRDIKKFLKKHHLHTRSNEGQTDDDDKPTSNASYDLNTAATSNMHHIKRNQHQAPVSSILAVNQMNLDCDGSPSYQMDEKTLFNQGNDQSIGTNLDHNQHHLTNNIDDQSTIDNNNSITNQINTQHHHHIQQNSNAYLSNNDEDLVTFQQALVQPATVRSIKFGHNNRRPSINSSQTQRPFETSNSEEDRLLELNQFLSEEYHRHVGSRKRSCLSIGGNMIKRARE